jgi:hypothetical protein
MKIFVLMFSIFGLVHFGCCCKQNYPNFNTQTTKAMTTFTQKPNLNTKTTKIMSTFTQKPNLNTQTTKIMSTFTQKTERPSIVESNHYFQKTFYSIK